MLQTRNGIDELIGNCKKKNKRNSTKLNSIRPKPNEVPTSDPKEISNYILNEYSLLFWRKLASKIPQTINTLQNVFDYLDPPLNRTFFFDPIIPEDINLEISILQDNKVHCLYPSPGRLLKLAKRFCHICTSSHDF